METYFMRTWYAQLKGAAQKRAQSAIHAIDCEVELVCVNDPGNQVRMWLERPNDGTNDHDAVRAERARCVAIVEAELSKTARKTA